MKVVAASVLLGLPVLPIYAQEPTSKGVNFYSLEREIQIGQEMAAILVDRVPIVRDPKLDAYVAALLDRLAKYADPRFTYRVSIYDDRKPLRLPALSMAMPVDAFLGKATEPVALPGGPILVPLSLLADAPDEGSFAFQLAHAMAHVALRHSTRQATRVEIQRVASIRWNTEPSLVSDAVLSAGQLGLELGLFNFARRFELDADRLACGILAESDYDPAAVVPYLEGLEPDTRRSRIDSVHPTKARRTETIQAQLEKLPARTYGAGTGDFGEMKARAAGLR